MFGKGLFTRVAERIRNGIHEKIALKLEETCRRSEENLIICKLFCNILQFFLPNLQVDAIFLQPGTENSRVKGHS